MSQWNNSYAYNNQYQDSNTWNGDLNNQYVNQGYCPNQQYDPGQQYVSFDEFVSQMQQQQGNNAVAPTRAQYNSAQYQNYAGQFNYQNVPSTSQTAHIETYNYGPTTSNVPNDVESYQSQKQYNAVLPEQNSYTNDISKSNLTPTATEFVPKNNSVKSSSSVQHVKPESSKSYNGVKESKSIHGSSSSTNWRERPQSSIANGSSQQNESIRHSETREPSSYSTKNQENREGNNRNSDNKYRNQESSRNQDSTRNYEGNNRNNESSSRYDSSNRNHESSSRNYEYNNRNYEGNRYNDHRGQSKSSKSKSKDPDRMFYNSSISKGTQDGRNGRETSGRGRNYAGSQRVRAAERTSAEDEQYASNYLQFREERAERMTKENTSSPARSRNKPMMEQG